MKTKSPTPLYVSCALTLIVSSAALPVAAQTPGGLGLHMHAGLTITGSVGTVYAVQATASLTPTNHWTSVAFLQLSASTSEWTDTTTTAGSRYYRAIALAPTNLAFIPPGTFRMGSPAIEVGRGQNESPQRAVTLSGGFFMGQFEVTQGEYLAVMGNNPGAFQGDLNRPVETVTWHNATNYCGKLTLQELAAGRIPAGTRFRLPTEAEWEYASRAWTSTRFNYGEDPDLLTLTDYAWYGDTSGPTTHPVGQKQPNLWGLYDMAGNVAEWCQDWYGEYVGEVVADPSGPASGSTRAIRGASHNNPPEYCRSAWRVSYDPAGSGQGLGFRLVLVPVGG